MKYSGSNRGLVYNSKHLGARAANLQRDGPRQAGVPDHKAGIGGGNQQGIIHIPYPAGHSLGQQGAGNQAKAPVEPAADGGHEGGNQDCALFVVSQGGNRCQRLLARLGGGHGGAQHQHQGHLHGEGQQAPEAILDFALAPPGPHQFQGPLLRTDHGSDKDHDGQDDGEQEWIRKPPVHNLYAAIGKAFEHETTSSVSLSATHTPWQELSKL